MAYLFLRQAKTFLISVHSLGVWVPDSVAAPVVEVGELIISLRQNPTFRLMKMEVSFLEHSTPEESPKGRSYYGLSTPWLMQTYLILLQLHKTHSELKCSIGRSKPPPGSNNARSVMLFSRFLKQAEHDLGSHPYMDWAQTCNVRIWCY